MRYFLSPIGGCGRPSHHPIFFKVLWMSCGWMKTTFTSFRHINPAAALNPDRRFGSTRGEMCCQSSVSAMLRQRRVSFYLLLICVSEKWHYGAGNWGKMDVSREKWVQHLVQSHKESVTIWAHPSTTQDLCSCVCTATSHQCTHDSKRIMWEWKTASWYLVTCSPLWEIIGVIRQQCHCPFLN